MTKGLRLLLPTFFLLIALASFSFASYNATGGIITYDGNYTIHTFTSNGTFSVLNDTINATILIIAGGGGGAYTGGGGGAGGLRYLNTTFTIGNTTVSVGAGGLGRLDGQNTRGDNGEVSAIGAFSTVGGGGGGGKSGGTGSDGATGGSGGGGRFEYASTPHYGGAGTTNQGYAGGNATFASGGWGSGGGGGAGGEGKNQVSSEIAGDGGAGVSININGTLVCYAGGGGGGITGDIGGRSSGAATCGGGAGGLAGAANGQNGTNGLGGGGGGSGWNHYNAGNGGNGVVIIRYLTYVEVTVVNNIVWLSQTPANLTSTNVISVGLNVSYNITNITSGIPYLNYSHNNTINNVLYYVNGTAISGWQQITGTNVSTVFNFSLSDNQIMPAVYTRNFSDFSTTAHTTYGIGNVNNYISTELFNVSNLTQYNYYEVMANSTSTIPVYYCNSTYAFGNAPGANSNCALLGNIPANQPYNHQHGALSSHQVLPFSINTTTGTFGSTTIKITPQSYFIVRGAIGTNIYGINNITRNTTTKLSTNNGNAYIVQNTSLDTHIHQFTPSSSINYQVVANISGALNNSSIFTQVFGLADLPPTPPAITYPNASGNYYGTINITWLISQNLTPGTITYNVSLLNSDLTFNKTLTNNTTNTYYSWNTAGTAQGNYVIMVNATNNASLSSYDYSKEFTVATFNATLLLPTNDITLAANQTLLEYSTNNIIVNANCTIYLDTVAVNSQIAFNGVYSYLTATMGGGTHSWYVSCADNESAGFTFTTATRTFNINYSSFTYSLNLTQTPANTYSEPQALFYDINGNINVLYYTDEITGSMLWIKTLNGSMVSASHNYSMERIGNFITALREPNKTVIFALNRTDTTKTIFINITSAGVLTVGTGTFSYNNALNNTFYDAYTYADTAHYQNINFTNNSFYLLNIPLANGTAYFKKYINNTTLVQVGTQNNLSASPSFQTLANNSQLTGWYYFKTMNTSATVGNIWLSYANDTTLMDITPLDYDYNASAISTAIGNFYEYGGYKYAVLANLTNTTLYLIDENKTYTFSEKMANPSFLFFTDKYTFLFFNQAGTTTNAYSCYFGGATANCTKFTATEYGINMPYSRGTLTTAKREGNSDVVARGVITSADVVRLLYEQNTYDGKYICYDEMAETRLTFKVSVYTDTTANIFNNATYGYVIPSSILGAGFKKAYFTCANGTQRLFIAGLNSNYTINSYSLQQPKGVYYTFQAINQYNIPIQNATISAYRFSVANQAFVIIEQGISDFNGNTIFYLEPYQFYKFIVQANGYVVLTFDLTPGADTVLEFKLSQTGGTILTIPTYDRVFNDVSYSIMPAASYQNQSFNITYSITSAQAGLQYYGMKITREFNNTNIQVFNTNTTGAGGGILVYTASLNGTYRVITWFKHQNYTEYQPPQLTYYLSPKQGLIEIRDRLPNMLGGWAYFMIATVVALIVAGYISRFTIDGAGIMGLVVLWFFTVMNPNAVIMGAAGCTLGTIGCITIVMATGLTTIIVVAGLLWKQFG